jgi:Sigma-70 region 2
MDMSNRRIDPLLASQSDNSPASTPFDEGDGDDLVAANVPIRESIEAAYQRLYSRLVGLAYLLVDTTEHAEEAVQDAVAKAYPKWTRMTNPDAYLQTAVVNTCRRASVVALPVEPLQTAVLAGIDLTGTPARVVVVIGNANPPCTVPGC